jgi:putative protease
MQSSHLLSIKDLDLSDFLPQLIDAGICSFKIEGRLKDIVYVKNNVSFLRKRLDNFLENNSEKYEKASSGRTYYNFQPQMDKSFNRGYTDYFLNKRKEKIGAWDSPKSKGEFIGKVIAKKANGYLIENSDLLNNGDGLYFINALGEADGAQVNIIVNDIVVFNTNKEIENGEEVYRNSDAEFIKLVEQEKSAIRKIAIKLHLRDLENAFILSVTDEDGYHLEKTFVYAKEVAKSLEETSHNIIKNLSKTGNTVFTVDDINIQFTQNWFIPISVINNWRREILDDLVEHRINSYVRKEKKIEKTNHPYPIKELDFTYNVSNQLARKFYNRHGVTQIEKAFELQWDPGKSRVMVTKYCVKYELGKCARFQRSTMGEKISEPLTLKHGEVQYKLKFNCKPCEMEIWEKDADLIIIDQEDQIMGLD